MLFNSFNFLFIFFPVVLTGYFLLLNNNKGKLAKLFLMLMSLYFYSYFNYRYTIIIIISILFNFFVGKELLKNRSKVLLIFGIIINISIICYFKYYNFFIDNINVVFGSTISYLKILMPLGISFFTFQQITYLSDMWNGKGEDYDIVTYSLFVLFFPQLIAGPIVHHNEIIPQFAEERKINYYNLSSGLFILSIGMFKKVIIADWLAKYANTGFSNYESITFIEAWITSITFSLQLYFDFSGYSDMAIGIGKMFNINIPLNFDSPYKSKDIQEFWRRWHKTLGRFLTEYVYYPLGGNRLGKVKTYRNLMIVFLLSGLWHGAGWTFIFWGFLHGIMILFDRFLKGKKIKLNKNLSWIATLFCVNIAWIFFRATKFEQAIIILKKMFLSKIDLHPYLVKKIPEFLQILFIENRSFLNVLSIPIKDFVVILIILLISLFAPNAKTLGENFNLSKKNYIYILLTLYIVIINLNSISTFLYFNF